MLVRVFVVLWIKIISNFDLSFIFHEANPISFGGTKLVARWGRVLKNTFLFSVLPQSNSWPYKTTIFPAKTGTRAERKGQKSENYSSEAQEIDATMTARKFSTKFC